MICTDVVTECPLLVYKWKDDPPDNTMKDHAWTTPLFIFRIGTNPPQHGDGEEGPLQALYTIKKYHSGWRGQIIRHHG